MKLRELVGKTGVPRETIQFYLREGILPKPRKRGRGQAEYGDHYLELIEFIKDLQEKHFLPLAVIKKVIKRFKNISPSEEHYFRMQSEFFSPVGYLLSQQEVKGEEQFLELTELGKKWLAKAMSWGIITPEDQDGVLVFSTEDVAIGKLMVEMDRVGMGPKNGFDPEVLRQYKDYMQDVIVNLGRTFTDHLYGQVSDEDFAEKGFRSLNLMGIYLFFLYRKLAQKDTLTYIKKLEQRKSEEKGEEK
ncbi:MAG: MerR family transcriptional regulator [Thermodesulfobacteriota bacterium]